MKRGRRSTGAANIRKNGNSSAQQQTDNKQSAKKNKGGRSKKAMNVQKSRIQPKRNCNKSNLSVESDNQSSGDVTYEEVIEPQPLASQAEEPVTSSSEQPPIPASEQSATPEALLKNDTESDSDSGNEYCVAHYPEEDYMLHLRKEATPEVTESKTPPPKKKQKKQKKEKTRNQSSVPVRRSLRIQLAAERKNIKNTDSSSNSNVVAESLESSSTSTNLRDTGNPLAVQNVAQRNQDALMRFLERYKLEHSLSPSSRTSSRERSIQRKKRYEAIVDGFVSGDNDEVLIEATDRYNECCSNQKQESTESIEEPIEAIKPPRFIPTLTESEPLTHKYLLTKPFLEEINKHFMCDPYKFCKMSLILGKESGKTGRIFKISPNIVDRTSSFSDEFIEFLAKSPITMEPEMQELVDYNNFSTEHRIRTGCLFNLSEYADAFLFHQNIDTITDLKTDILKDLPADLLAGAEDSVIAVAQIFYFRYIDSFMKLAALATVDWVEKTSLLIRLKFIFYGWRMFVQSGGFFKVLLAFDREDVKMSEEFKTYCAELLKKIEHSYDKVLILYHMTKDEMVNMIRTNAGVSEEELISLNADVLGQTSETHIYHCKHCENQQMNVWFSDISLLEIHKKLHTHGQIECIKCYDGFIESHFALHTINKHCGNNFYQ